MSYSIAITHTHRLDFIKRAQLFNGFAKKKEQFLMKITHQNSMQNKIADIYTYLINVDLKLVSSGRV